MNEGLFILFYGVATLYFVYKRKRESYVIFFVGTLSLTLMYLLCEALLPTFHEAFYDQNLGDMIPYQVGFSACFAMLSYVFFKDIRFYWMTCLLVFILVIYFNAVNYAVWNLLTVSILGAGSTIGVYTTVAFFIKNKEGLKPYF